MIGVGGIVLISKGVELVSLAELLLLLLLMLLHRLMVVEGHHRLAVRDSWGVSACSLLLIQFLSLLGQSLNAALLRRFAKEIVLHYLSRVPILRWLKCLLVNSYLCYVAILAGKHQLSFLLILAATLVAG